MRRPRALSLAAAASVFLAPRLAAATPVAPDNCVENPAVLVGSLGTPLDFLESRFTSSDDVMRSAVYRAADGRLGFVYQVPTVPHGPEFGIDGFPTFRALDAFRRIDPVPGFDPPATAPYFPLQICNGWALPGRVTLEFPLRSVPSGIVFVVYSNVTGYTLGSAIASPPFAPERRAAAFVPVSAPEPSTLALMTGGGLLLAAVAARRRRR